MVESKDQAPEIYFQLPKDPSSVEAGSVFPKQPYKVDLNSGKVTPETPDVKGRIFAGIERVEEPTSLDKIVQASDASVVIVHLREPITNYSSGLPSGTVLPSGTHLEIYKS